MSVQSPLCVSLSVSKRARRGRRDEPGGDELVGIFGIGEVRDKVKVAIVGSNVAWRCLSWIP